MSLPLLLSFTVPVVMCACGGVIMGTRGARPWGIPLGLSYCFLAGYVVGLGASMQVLTEDEYAQWSQMTWAPAPVAVFFFWVAGALAAISQGEALIRHRSAYLVGGLTAIVASLGTVDSLYAYEAIDAGGPQSLAYTAVPTTLYPAMIGLTAGGTLHATLNVRRAWLSSGSGAYRDLYAAFAVAALIAIASTLNFFFQIGVPEPYIMFVMLVPIGLTVWAARRTDCTATRTPEIATNVATVIPDDEITTVEDAPSEMTAEVGCSTDLLAEALFDPLDQALRNYRRKLRNIDSMRPMVALGLATIEQEAQRLAGGDVVDEMCRLPAAANVVEGLIKSLKPRGSLGSTIDEALDNPQMPWPKGCTLPPVASDFYVLTAYVIHRQDPAAVAKAMGFHKRFLFKARARAIKVIAERLAALEVKVTNSAP